MLAYNTVYTATISTGVQSLAGTPMTNAYGWTFSTVPAPTPRPTVIATVPLNLAVGVPVNRALIATFSEAMDPATINTTTFLLTVTGGAAVNGVVTYVTAGSVATFVPNAPLTANTSYTATITTGATGATNLAGASLAQNYIWTFTTAAVPITAAPMVISTMPVTSPEDVAVPLNQLVSATFSEAMSPASITTITPATFTLTGPGNTPVAGLVTYAAIGNELVFLPSANLSPNTTYTATITTAAQDLAGNPLASNYVWTFMTGSALNTISPELVSTIPVNTASNVALNQAVSATFSEAMNPLSLTSATFQLTQGGTLIPATLTYDSINFIATLTPTNPFTANTTYTVTVTNGATDLDGNPLGNTGSPNPWFFNTGTALITQPIVLGPTIAQFGGVSGTSGLTNQGISTVINGNAGTTATGFSSFTGFHDDTVLVGDVPQCVYTETGSNIGLVNGTIYSPLVVPPPFVCPLEGTPATITIATEALAEAQTAYTTLQGLPSIGVLAAELGNTTIYPGVYKNLSSVGITAGDLTLDAQGDPNATWVFQIGSTLTIGEASAFRNIILKNGAKPGNIYWAVGTNAYINAAGGGTVAGTIIASGFIHVSTVGNSIITTIDGRLIGLNASVTLVNTVINVPAP
jgi:hypothetical protein